MIARAQALRQHATIADPGTCALGGDPRNAVLPLLGTVVGGFQLTTLKLETSLRSNVRERYPWMGAADLQADLGGACLKWVMSATMRQVVPFF